MILGRIEEFCYKRKMSDRVRERIVRLNRNTKEGDRLRGLHRNNPKDVMLFLDLIPKQHFIEKYGSAAWRCIPNGLLYRYGRRRYIAKNTVLDNIWKVWSGDIPPTPMMEWFPTKKYANDPARIWLS